MTKSIARAIRESMPKDLREGEECNAFAKVVDSFLKGEMISPPVGSTMEAESPELECPPTLRPPLNERLSAMTGEVYDDEVSQEDLAGTTCARDVVLVTINGPAATQVGGGVVGEVMRVKQAR